MLKFSSTNEMPATSPRVLCKEFLPVFEGTVAMIYSFGGVGKSFSAIRESIAYVKQTGKKVALWLTEDDAGETKIRYDRLVKDVAGSNTKFYNDRIVFIRNAPVKFTKLSDGNAVMTEEFDEIRLDLMDYDMIVIDPLLQFQGCDENSNTHAGVFMGAMKEWAEEENKTILLLHHATYTGNNNAKARGAGEWVNGTRGAYVIGYVTDDRGEKDITKNQYRRFALTKENGIGIHFLSDNYEQEYRDLKVFPPCEERRAEDKYKTDTVRMSIAEHSDLHNSRGYNPVKVQFSEIHTAMQKGSYSQFQFADGHRKGENNLGFSDVIILDIDSGMTLPEAEQVFADIYCCVITTKSHGKKGKGDRFRVAIMLSEPLQLPENEYKQFMTELFKHFGDHPDAATKDMARVYQPSPEDAFYFYTDCLNIFDWRKFNNKIKKDIVRDRLHNERRKKQMSKYSDRTELLPNELSADTMFTLRGGVCQSFETIASSLSIGQTENVECLDGHGHNGGGRPEDNLAGFIKRVDYNRVKYQCAGAKCANNEPLWLKN